MKPRFALDLTEEAISLLSREGEAWQLVGRVALDGADVHRALTGLRHLARAYGDAFATKLVLPEAQILYFQIPDHGFDTASRRAQVLAALNGRTPYPVDDLVFDFAVRDGTIMVAAIAGLTLQEAEEFAEGYGFHPVCFVAAPGQDQFDGEPFFGLTRNSGAYLAAGARLERDARPIRISPSQMKDGSSAPAEPEAAPFVDVPDVPPLPEIEVEAEVGAEDTGPTSEQSDSVSEEPTDTGAPSEAVSDPVDALASVDGGERAQDPEPEVPEAPAPEDPETPEPGREEPQPDLPPEPEPAPQDPEPVEIPAQPVEPEPDAPPAVEPPLEEPAPAELEPQDPDPELPAPLDPLPDLPPSELPGEDAPWPEDGTGDPSGEPELAIADAVQDSAPEADEAPAPTDTPVADADASAVPEPDAEAEVDESVTAPALPGVTTDLPPAAFQSRRLVASADDETGAITRSLAPRLGGLTAPPERAPLPPARPAPGVLLAEATKRAAHAAALGQAMARNTAASARAALGNGRRSIGERLTALRPAMQSLSGRAKATTATLMTAANAQRKPLLIGAASLSALVLLIAAYSFWPASQPATTDDQLAAQISTAPDPETTPAPADAPDATTADQIAPDDSGDVTPPADEEPAAPQEPAPAATDANGDSVPLAPYDMGTVEKPAAADAVTDPFDYHVATPQTARGVTATAAGILMAGGFTLIEGKPAILPKARPADLAQKALEARAPKPDPRVVGRKPKARPASLVPPAPTTPETTAPAPQPLPADQAPAGQAPGDQTALPASGQTPALAAAAPAAAELLPGDPKLAKFRPKARPASVEKAAAAQKATEEAARTALASATKLAVANSPRPEPKPVVSLQVEAAPTVLSAPSQAIDQSAVEAALAEAQTAEEVQAQPEVDAVPQVPVVPEPDNSGPVDEPELQNGVPNMPTTKTVAKKSTVKNAIDLGETNLIGVYGSDNSRRALVRLASGRYVKVKIGDRLDGGRVVAIGDNQLSYEKKGRTIVLKMITKG